MKNIIFFIYENFHFFGGKIFSINEPHCTFGCAPSEDSDRPSHPTSLIKIFTGRTALLWIIWIIKIAKFLQTENGDWSDCADVQPYLSLRWAHIRAVLSESSLGAFYNQDCKMSSSRQGRYF